MRQTQTGVVFDSYADLVRHALKSEEIAKLWYRYLDQMRKREDARKEALNDVRRKHPGLADHEIDKRIANWLNSKFPAPSLTF